MDGWAQFLLYYHHIHFNVCVVSSEHKFVDSDMGPYQSHAGLPVFYHTYNMSKYSMVLAGSEQNAELMELIERWRDAFKERQKLSVARTSGVFTLGRNQ